MQVSKKYWLCLISIIILFQLSVSNAFAALITINQQGEIVWNVLASENEFNNSKKQSSVQIVNLPQNIETTAESLVSLVRENGKVEVKVSTNQGEKAADVTNYQDEIIEVEQKEAAKKLQIVSEGDQFVLVQHAIAAQTSYPITINSKDKRLSVETPSGIHYVEVFPQDVFQNLANAHVIDQLSSEGRMILDEGDAGVLLYQVNGEKIVDILNLFTITAPISLQVSANSGEILSIDKPTWLKIFGFLLT